MKTEIKTCPHCNQDMTEPMTIKEVHDKLLSAIGGAAVFLIEDKSSRTTDGYKFIETLCLLLKTLESSFGRIGD